MLQVVLISIGLALGSSASWAGTFAFECPPQVEVEVQAKDVPNGWDQIASPTTRVFALSTAAVFSGPPDLRYELKPTQMARRSPDAPLKIVYEFSSTYSDGLYFLCRYGGTDVSVFRRMNPTPVRCQFELPGGKGDPPVIQLTCDD